MDPIELVLAMLLAVLASGYLIRVLPFSLPLPLPLLQIARQHRISDERSRKLIRELDLAEARYR